MLPKKAATGQQSATSPASTPKKAPGKENAKWMLKDEKAFEWRTAGSPKTGTTCKNKWARIKGIHAICYKLKHGQGTLGFTWSEKRGADIGLEDKVVWEAYIKKTPKG
ncbi:hypothetical protein VTO73DRAFT_10231 [Trametes versicolor]